MNHLNSINNENTRILVAEDSVVVRTTISALLESSGIGKVATSPSFYDAIELVEAEGPFDLVLLDYHMPGMESLHGLQRMIVANDMAPVGLISGGIPFDLIEEAVLKGAAGFIPKSLPPRLIVQAVKTMSKGQRYRANHFLEMTRTFH